MSAPRTEAAITSMREMIVSGLLRPGEKLPPEAELTLSERHRIMGGNADRVYRLGVSTVDVHPAAV